MRWIASFGIALLTSIAATFGAGTVAGVAVDWYNVSSFEGGAGFFVVGMALVGLIAGFLIGLVVSRIEARQAQPRFIKALGLSAGAVAVLLAVIGGAAWVIGVGEIRSALRTIEVRRLTGDQEIRRPGDKTFS